MVFWNSKERKHVCRILYERKRWPLEWIRRATTVTPGTLRRWILADGWTRMYDTPKNRVRYTPDKRQQVLQLLEFEGSIAETSRKTNIHRRTIGRWMRAEVRTDDAPPRWRCYCRTEFGHLVEGNAPCHSCGQDRTLVAPARRG